MFLRGRAGVSRHGLAFVGGVSAARREPVGSAIFVMSRHISIGPGMRLAGRCTPDVRRRRVRRGCGVSNVIPASTPKGSTPPLVSHDAAWSIYRSDRVSLCPQY